MRRLPSGLFAIAWLLALHVLADVAVGLYRLRDVDRELTDWLAAALPRAQVCLLALWLGVGSERWSWRIAGLVGGCCFLFVVFSRTVFPGQYGISAQAHWLQEEWAYYFRQSGPGDLLVKLPILIGGVVAPLLVWRIGRQRMSGSESRWRWRRLNETLQFRLQDVAVWALTLSIALAAIFRTAPYDDWFEQLFDHWRRFYQLQDSADCYSVFSAVLYVLIAFVSLWLVYGKTTWWLRLPISLAFVIAPACALDRWLQNIAEPTDTAASIWSQAPAESLISGLAFATTAGSLFLYRLYGAASASQRRELKHLSRF